MEEELDDMRMSPEKLKTLTDISYEYGKLYAKHRDKRDEVRTRWDAFCEEYVGSGLENFETLDKVRQRFKEGCFANYWS